MREKEREIAALMGVRGRVVKFGESERDKWVRLESTKRSKEHMGNASFSPFFFPILVVVACWLPEPV